MESLSLRHANLLVDNLVSYAGRALPTILQLVEGEHTGFAITAHFSGEEFQITVTALVGAPNSEKKKDYWFFSTEKDARLTSQPGHVSSAQSADKALNRYAGAVRSGRLILSISAFKQLDDEALVLAILTRVGVLTPVEAERISALSGSIDRYLKMVAALPIA